MSIQMFANSLRKSTALVAIAATSTLIALPAFAGSMSSPKQTSETTSPSSSPSNSAPSTSDAPTPSTPSSSEMKPVEAPAAAPSSSETQPTDAPSSPTSQSSSGNIVDVASSSKSFKTLTAAVKAAGLTEVLSGEGPYTVFAPTDEAFAALPKGTVEKLLMPQNKAKLQKLLAYHVIPGAVGSASIKPGQVTTVEGSAVKVGVSGSQVMINNAKVTGPDIKASNGVIHAIDKVIVPPDL